MRRPRSTAIDSGTIAATGDGSTAPSENLDGIGMEQVGEQRSKLWHSLNLEEHNFTLVRRQGAELPAEIVSTWPVL